jgi:hypothetical protein
MNGAFWDRRLPCWRYEAGLSHIIETLFSVFPFPKVALSTKTSL